MSYSEKVTFDERGLVFHGEMTIKEWLDLGTHVTRISRSQLFWIGDFVNYGEAKYGEKYAQALSNTQYDYGTLRNAAYACARIPLEARDPSLPFSHHYVVAKLELSDAKRLLAISAEKGLTAKELRVLAWEIIPPKQQKIYFTFDQWLEAYLALNAEIWPVDPSGNVQISDTWRQVMEDSWNAGQENKK